MFDSLWLFCPECETPHEYTVTNGPCAFNSYTLDSAPDSILLEIEALSPFTCKECGAIFAIELSGGKNDRRIS
jgi:hypothetical protein